jgi:hypothetical protein
VAVQAYEPDVEQYMKTLYESLNERDRRRYAAVEARRLGHGGQTYIRGLFGCDYKTMRRGLADLDDPPDLPLGRVRKKGGKAMLSLLARVARRVSHGDRYLHCR